MRSFDASGLFGRGRKRGSLCLKFGASRLVLALGLGLGLGFGLMVPRAAQAAVCFLPDCGGKLGSMSGNLNISSKYCKSMGYTYYSSGKCPEYQVQDTCKFSSHYLKCDAGSWCKNNGYTVEPGGCTVPQYVGTQCPNGQALYKPCQVDYQRACREENSEYVSECEEGWQLDESRLCSYSEAYGICCNKCSAYPYTESQIPAGYVKDESCTACGNVVRYKIVPNPCTGYQKCSDTPKSGTASCLHGNETWYKECCAYECSLSSCPSGTDCSFEVCSSKYCAVGCLTGYTDYCQQPVTDCSTLGYNATSCSGNKLVCPYNRGLFYCM